MGQLDVLGKGPDSFRLCLALWDVKLLRLLLFLPAAAVHLPWY